jgi:excisionase family DNA binding protein
LTVRNTAPVIYDDEMDTIGTIDRKQLLKPGEVARILRVDPKTVTRWAGKNKLRSVRTPGGHRRFYAADVLAILEGPKEG